LGPKKGDLRGGGGGNRRHFWVAAAYFILVLHWENWGVV